MEFQNCSGEAAFAVDLSIGLTFFDLADYL